MTSTRARGIDAGVIEISNGETTQQFEFDRVVVAVGRRPNTAELGLEEAGIEVGADGLLAVAPDRRVTPRIAAIGDLTPGPALAHKASAEAAVAIDALCGRPAAFDPAAIPAVVFSDPEIATVGTSESEARELGDAVNVARTPLAASGRAATLDARLGFAQVVSARDDGAILGVQVVAPHASELIAEAALAIEMGASAEDLALTVHPHPTLGELLADTARDIDLP